MSSESEPRSLSVPSLWTLAVAVPAGILAVGLVVAPDLFYDRFIWKYFYGPVRADAFGQSSITRNGVTAYPGYTLVSEAGYAYSLGVAAFGVVRLVRRWDIATSDSFFYALFPYAFVGGAFRVVEDTGVLDWPINFFVISPIIYFVMFAVVVLFLFVSLRLERSGYVDSYTKPLACLGVVWLTFLLVFLVWFGVSNGTLVPWVPFATFGMATAVWAVVWYGIKTFAPSINEGTGKMGAVILWGHLVDGSATTIGIEHLGYSQKHPVVQTIIQTSGTTYTFILVKAVAVLVVLYLFDEKSFEEFKRLSYILLVAVLMVGLGPGSRDFLRATVGV